LHIKSWLNESIFCYINSRLCSFLCDTAQEINSYDILKNNFINPPDNARPKVYWWWLNGRTDPSRIKSEIEAMKNAGISGFDIFEIGVPAGDTVIKPDLLFSATNHLEQLKWLLMRQ